MRAKLVEDQSTQETTPSPLQDNGITSTASEKPLILSDEEIEQLEKQAEAELRAAKLREEVAKTEAKAAAIWQQAAHDQANGARANDIVNNKIEHDNLAKTSQARESRLKLVFGWLKAIFATLMLLALLLAVLILGWRAYRWATEAPLIKEIETKVEVPVETIIEREVEKEVAVEVIPSECTQIRRHGQVFISCDGVEVNGVPTVGDAGLTEIPELVTD